MLEARGMPRFAELSDAELTTLLHYLRARARGRWPHRVAKVTAAPTIETRRPMAERSAGADSSASSF
jgi:hypothetical protein